jgi:hypothetical protein
VVSGRSVVQPHPFSCPQFFQNNGIAVRNGISNNASDWVQWNIVDAEPPYKLIYMADMFLMRFWSKDSLKEPSPIVNLRDMAKLLEGSHSFMHNRQLVGAIHDLLDSNGMRVAGVNDTLKVLTGTKMPRSSKIGQYLIIKT